MKQTIIMEHSDFKFWELGGNKTEVLTAKIRLEACGQGKPHFSVTGEGETRKGDRVWNERCGCLHEEILQHWPEFHVFVALHLSDEDGVPLYAVENGYYHLGFTEYSDFNPEVTAKHFRISLYGAKQLRAAMEAISPENRKAFLERWVDRQKVVWKREAEQAKRQIKILNGETVEIPINTV